MLNTTTNDKAVGNWENVSDSVSRVNDQSSQIIWLHVCERSIALRTADLTEQCESCLNTDEKPLNSESLEHDFCDLLSVLRWVHGWLRENEPVLLWLAPQIGIHGLVPELLDSLPVLDLARLENVAKLVSFRVLDSFVTDEEVQLRVVQLARWFLNNTQLISHS